MKILMVLVMVFFLMGFSINSDTTFHLKRGETIEGRFIVEGYSSDMILRSNMEWISLDENKYISERPISGSPIIDDTYYVSYWINVPKKSDIGIYRGTISVQRGEDIKYLNIKMSVQNSVVTLFFKGFNKPLIRYIILFGVFMILFFLLYVFFKGDSYKR